MREKAREPSARDRFLEVYLSAPADFCKQRDTTGAYDMAAAGQIASFPGVSAAFEPPANPDLVLPTHEISVNEAVGRVLELLKKRNSIE